MKATFPLLTAVALFLVPPRAVAQVPFTLSATLTNGSYVRTVTTMDVNNDGKRDLICGRYNPSFLYVWTNGGDGLFVSNAAYAVSTRPKQVITADVNNDSKLDLITANTGNTLTVLTNDANGGFVLAASLPLGGSSQPVSVAAADFNSDGWLDLVSANSLLASVTVWTSIGGGLFVSNFSLSVGSPGSTVPQSAATADVNGDGKPDIICACNNSYPYFFLWTNNGTGGFASAPVPYQDYGVICVLANDVNGDGKPDLACLTSADISTSAVKIYTNNGVGAFVLSSICPVGNNPAYTLAAGDVNGDEKVDFISTYGMGNLLIVFTNAGSGAFGSNTAVTAGFLPEGLAAADLNDDGRVDLVTANWNPPGGMTLVTNASTFLPRLTLKRSGPGVIVSWPAIWANWTLQQNTNLVSGNWTSYSGPVGNDGATKSATTPASASIQCFRLANP